MLKVNVGSDNFIRLSVPLGIEITGNLGTSEEWVTHWDPLLRYFRNNNSLVVSLEPIAVSDLLSDIPTAARGSWIVSRRPEASKVKDNTLYDEQQYGSFFDSIQGFWSVLHGDLSLDPPSKKMLSQHYVRHRTFKGQASIGMQNLSDSVNTLSLFSIDLDCLGYSDPVNAATIGPGGSLAYDVPWGSGPVMDVSPYFQHLLDHDDVRYTYNYGSSVISATISSFRNFLNDAGLQFMYHSNLEWLEGGVLQFISYEVYYYGGIVEVLTDVPPYARFRLPYRRYGIRNVETNTAIGGAFEREHETLLSAFVSSYPLVDQAEDVTRNELEVKLQEIAKPFWGSVDLQWSDITALSRDTATVALNRLSAEAFEPNVGRIGAINPLKIAGDSLLAKTADAALKDAQRNTLKDILRMGGGAGLVKYRTLFSDCLQLINSLEVLGEMKNTPSRQYTADASFVYHVVLGGRNCKIRVRSKAYLNLSPFRLIQILIGKQAVIIVNDILAAYYSSLSLGELLLTILQLRKIGDTLSNRMFYDLPLFFVHSYEVEYQLTQADLDYTGISTVLSEPPRAVYYIRDVSRYLPTMRFSNLSPFYSTGDVGNIIWTLLQQLAGVLSSGA